MLPIESRVLVTSVHPFRGVWFLCAVIPQTDRRHLGMERATAETDRRGAFRATW